MAGNFPGIDSTTISQWPEANIFDPVTRSWFPVCSITLEAVATLVVSIRLWTQARKATSSFHVDDILICAAWVFITLFTALCLLGTLKYGFDKHIWDVTSTLYRYAALVQWLSEAAFTIGLGLAKISVLCFYRRLDPPCTKSFKKIICLLIAFTTCYTVACLLTELLICRPVSAYWTIPGPRMGEGRKCSQQGVSYLIQGIMDTCTTVYTIWLPFLAFSNLPMSQNQRNALVAVFVTALSVVGAGIARTVFLFRLANSTNGDATWNGFNVFVCAQLEGQFALICASLPYLRTYFIPDHSVRISFDASTKQDSVISRVSSSLSGQIKRLPLVRTASPKIGVISRPIPRMMEIPAWEFETIQSPRYAGSPVPVSPVDEISYEQYVRGQFGPPAPPKDSRALFDHYRMEHGEIV